VHTIRSTCSIQNCIADNTIIVKILEDGTSKISAMDVVHIDSFPPSMNFKDERPPAKRKGLL
jgi:hypothetical protein